MKNLIIDVLTPLNYEKPGIVKQGYARAGAAAILILFGASVHLFMVKFGIVFGPALIIAVSAFIIKELVERMYVSAKGGKCMFAEDVMLFTFGAIFYTMPAFPVLGLFMTMLTFLNFVYRRY